MRVYRSAWKFVRERFYGSHRSSIDGVRNGAQVVVKQLYGVVRARNRYFINSIVIAGQSCVSWLLFAGRVYNESALYCHPVAGTEECQYRGLWRKEREGGGLINCGHYQPTISYFSQTHSFRSYSSSFCISPSLFLLASGHSTPLSFCSLPSLAFSLGHLWMQLSPSHSRGHIDVFHRAFRRSINKCACYLPTHGGLTRKANILHARH